MSDHWMKADAAMFLADFGEPVGVVINKVVVRTIQAIVDRVSPGVHMGRKTDGRMSVEVANDATLGLEASVDIGAVRLRLEERLGDGKPRDWMLALSDNADGTSDPGMLTFNLR